VAQEVTDVVELRARLEQPTGELAPQVVKVETHDLGPLARRPPCSFHGTDTIAHFCTEHIRLRPQLPASRIVSKHLENGTEPLTDWNDACFALSRPGGPSRQARRAPQAPPWLHRDRDRIYADVFKRRLAGMGITEIVSAPASPWQNPYVERLIGSIRRECLDHVVVVNEAHLRRVLRSYRRYYHRSRTHLGLEKDTPDHRPVSETSIGPIVAIPEVGGLHHRYERRAA
jgi:Integrase core domain